MKSILPTIALATALTGGIAEGSQINDITSNTTDQSTKVINTELIGFRANEEQDKKTKAIKTVAINVGSVMALLGGGIVVLRRRKRKQQDTTIPQQINKPSDTGKKDSIIIDEISPENIPTNFNPEAYRLYQSVRKISKLYIVKAGVHIFNVTDIFIGERKHLLGFVLLGGKYQVRYFYYSASGGNWHCAPGFDGKVVKNGDISKENISLGSTLSDENTTIVHHDLASIFDKLPISSSQTSIDNLLRNQSIFNQGNNQQEQLTQRSITQEADRVIDELKQDGVNITTLLSDSRSYGEIFGDTGSHYEMSALDSYCYIENIPVPKEIIDNLEYLSEGKTWKHEQLGVSVSSVLCQSKFQGKDIIIEYATGSDKPHSPWIEIIYFKDATISTWGFLREQINPGILRIKPLEYASQCPKYIQRSGARRGAYIDIREFTQGNPLIEACKKI